MRLIDADALLKALNDYGLSYRADINGMIMQAPTIEPSGDLISRAEAVKTIMSEPMNKPHYPIWFANKLKELPSADAVHGEWQLCEDEDGIYGVCSICGCQPWYEHDIHTLNYCPNCGADMRSRYER